MSISSAVKQEGISPENLMTCHLENSLFYDNHCLQCIHHQLLPNNLFTCLSSHHKDIVSSSTYFAVMKLFSLENIVYVLCPIMYTHNAYGLSVLYLPKSVFLSITKTFLLKIEVKQIRTLMLSIVTLL